MKKIFTILLALSALSIVMSGCSKAEEEAKPADAAGTDAKPADAEK